MGPLLVSALIGVGVKIATELFTSGVKKAVGSSAPGQGTFSALLDRAKGTGAAGSATPAAAAGSAATTTATPRLAAAEQMPLGMAGTSAAVPSASRAFGAASYQRMDVEAP